MTHQSYYGESGRSDCVGSTPGLDRRQKGEAGLPESDSSQHGDVLEDGEPWPGRYVSLWRAGLPDGYEYTRAQGVPVIRPVQKGTIADFFKLKKYELVFILTRTVPFILVTLPILALLLVCEL